METFIENMIRIRKEKALTQHDLAVRLGTKQSAVSRIERGDEDITLSRAESISNALGVELSEMVAAHEFSK